MLAAPCSLCGLFDCNWTKVEELLNGCHRLTECKGQYVIFGVSLDPTHRTTFLSPLRGRAVEGCALTLTLLKPDKECKQVFVACFKIWKHSFC